MAKQYTVTQQGNRWIASNGEDHVEDDDPQEAFNGLVVGEASAVGGFTVAEHRELDNHNRISERIANSCVRLIASTAFSNSANSGPAIMLRQEVKMLAENVELFILANNLDV